MPFEITDQEVEHYADRILFAMMAERSPSALRAVRRATQLLFLGVGAVLAQLRDACDPIQALHAIVTAQAILVKVLLEALEIQASRFDKIPRRTLPHFAPAARFGILRFMDVTKYSAERLHASSASTSPRSTDGRRSYGPPLTGRPSVGLSWMPTHPSVASRTASAT